MVGPGYLEPPISLAGPLRRVLIPESIYSPDLKDLGRAMLAWRYDLSRTEVLLLEQVTRGLTNSEIAECMAFAEENTVKNYLKAIFQKMGVSNRTRAAVIGASYGLGADLPTPHRAKE